jgi:hypothetical protein
LNFEELMKYKPKITFKISEKDLNLDPNMRTKTYFTDEDMRMDHSNERLHKGEVEIPVFRDSTIRPLGFKGKLLDYEIENNGAGFYTITHKRGKMKPKSNDRRHPQEEIDRKNGGLFTFYITYDRTSNTYKYIESEKTFLSQYAEIDELKNSEEVQALINQFINWIQTFWKNEYKKDHHFGVVTSSQTYQDYLDVISDIESNLPMIRSYHLLLNIFGDICDTTYGYILNSLKNLEKHMNNARNHIASNYPNTKQYVNHHNDEQHGKPLLDCIRYMEDRILSRGYYVDREAKKAYRNVAEIFYGEQFSKDFESDSSKQETFEKQLTNVLEKTSNVFFLIK